MVVAVGVVSANVQGIVIGVVGVIIKDVIELWLSEPTMAVVASPSVVICRLNNVYTLELK